MAQVLVERARSGPRERLKRCKPHQWQWRHSEDALEREPMSRGRGTKSLSENFGPLKRYLRSQVYAEISAHLRPTSAVQQHVRDHLEDFVLLHVWRDADGLVGQAGCRLLRLNEAFAHAQFYVDPRSGLLRACKQKRARRRRQVDPDLRWDGAWRQLRRIDGLWYAFELAAIPRDPSEQARARDALLGKSVSQLLEPEARAALRQEYGRAGVFAARKRQLSKRELRDLAGIQQGYTMVWR
jgi:hypothetical protein